MSGAPASERAATFTLNEADPPVLTDLTRRSLANYTVEAVREMLPDRTTGQTARVVHIDDLYFLHGSNIVEMDAIWKAGDHPSPTAVFLSRGSYSLEALASQIDDASVLSRTDDGAYLLRRPVYIAPTATLLVLPQQVLRMSSNDGVFLYSNGGLLIVGATVEAWDTRTKQRTVRPPLTQDTALLYSHQPPRPYVLASEGSRTYIAGSRILGLGYKGTSGTFGLSMTPSIGGGRLGDHLRRLPPPTGWLIGNRIEGLYFGFYSNRAEDVAIVGNLFTNNIIYGVDPHDYSQRLLVARNIAQGATFAHGIIFSRGVRDSEVIENITIANEGTGIMMDRDSGPNLLADNLVVGNRGDGIAVFESDDNRIHANMVQRNWRNGVFVRNSVAVVIDRNEVASNGRSAVEIAATDISGLETRDFQMDPFEQRARADLAGNRFHDNARSAVSLSGADVLGLFANRYTSSGPLYFDGDLQMIAPRLLAAELGGNGGLRLLRKNAPATVVPRVASPKLHGPVRRHPSRVLEQQARRGTPKAMLALARHHLRSEAPEGREQALYWYARAIHHARVSAMSELGVMLAGDSEQPIDRRLEGLVLLAMAQRLGDEKAAVDIALLPDLLGGVNEADVEAARSAAAERLRQRTLWNTRAFRDIKISLRGAEAAKARERVKRLLSTPVQPRTAPLSRRQDPQSKVRLHARAKSKNDKQKNLNVRLRAARRAQASAVGEERAYHDRLHQRDESAALRVQIFADSEWQALRDRIDTMLQRINTHRGADDPITLKEIIMPNRIVQGAGG